VNLDTIPFHGDQQEYLKVLVERLSALSEVARENIDATKKKDEKQYNERHKVQPPSWNIGDQVLIKEKNLRHADKVITSQRYQDGFIITDIVQSPGFGASYKLVNTRTGKPVRNLISHDRLKRDNSGKRSDFEVRIPPLTKGDARKNANHASNNDSGDNEDDTAVTNTTGDSVQMTDNVMSPALRILREQRKGNRKEYYVEFTDKTRSWCQEISPALMNGWLVIKSQRLARKRKRKRTQY
jgi:hypothetical protein